MTKEEYHQLLKDDSGSVVTAMRANLNNGRHRHQRKTKKQSGHVMDIPEIKDWESPTGWCRRLAQLYGMNETQTAVLEEVRRLAYIQGVNDMLDRGRCGTAADGTA